MSGVRGPGVYPEFIPESPPLESQQGNVSSLAFFSLPRVYPRESPLDSQQGNVSSLAFLSEVGGSGFFLFVSSTDEHGWDSAHAICYIFNT